MPYIVVFLRNQSTR